MAPTANTGTNALIFGREVIFATLTGPVDFIEGYVDGNGQQGTISQWRLYAIISGNRNLVAVADYPDRGRATRLLWNGADGQKAPIEFFAADSYELVGIGQFPPRIPTLTNEEVAATVTATIVGAHQTDSAVNSIVSNAESIPPNFEEVSFGVLPGFVNFLRVWVDQSKLANIPTEWSLFAISEVGGVEAEIATTPINNTTPKNRMLVLSVDNAPIASAYELRAKQTSSTPIPATSPIDATFSTQSPPSNQQAIVEINVLNYGADPTGVLDSTAAFESAVLAASPTGTILVPGGTYKITSFTMPTGLELVGEGPDSIVEFSDSPGLIISAESGKTTQISQIQFKAMTSLMTLIDMQTTSNSSIAYDKVTFDANGLAFLLVIGGALLDTLSFSNCDFLNMSAECEALALGNMSVLDIDRCLFSGNGTLVSTAIAVTQPVQALSITNNRFRGMNTGISIASGAGQAPSIQDVTIENNRFDMMYYSAPKIDDGSGATVSYTSNTLKDTNKTFTLQPSGTIGTFNQFSYIRALDPISTGTTLNSSRSQLVDGSASFTTDGIIVGDLVRCGTAQAIAVSIEDDTHVNLEEWLNISDMKPAITPTGQYTIYKVILGRATSAASDTVTLDRIWADLDGNAVTPSAQTLYEIAATPNYPLTTSGAVNRARIKDNDVARSYTDSLSPFGDQCELSGNIIRDGQDVGITVDGSVGITNVKGGRHDVHDNLIIRSGSEGIYFGGEYEPCIHHNRIFGWGARAAGISSPGAGESGIDLNPAAVTSITGGTVDHNVIDGDGLPNSYYGLTAVNCIGIAFDTNQILNAVHAEYNIQGSNTADNVIRNQTADIDYSFLVLRGVAPGQSSNLIGSGPPLGTVTAGPGSIYVDKSSGLAWVKTSGTDTSGWQYINTTEFTPATISNGLQFFVRADLGLTLSGSDVHAWDDQSGNNDTNRNLIGSATHYPTISTSDADFNNKPCLVFDPSTLVQFLQSGTWSVPLPAVSTWFYVVKARVSGIMVATSGISSTHRQDLLANSGSFGEISSGGDCLSTRNIFQGTRAVIGIFDGVNSKIYISQHTGEAGGDTGAETLTGLTVGALYDAASFGFDGKISDITAWNRVLTDDEIASLNTYANTRYAISII